MHIPLGSGEVRTEFIDSVLHFKARDLRDLVGSTTKVWTRIDERFTKIGKYNENGPREGSYKTKYVALDDVLNFMDSINKVTKQETMQLMYEFKMLFNENLE